MTQELPENDAPRGIFITFEGGEGAGKSTHIRFLAEKLRARHREVVCLREPGGTEIGEQLRRVLLDPRNSALSAEAELLLYEAARAQIVAEVVRPALERGAVVLCDRFTDSTVAYQGYGRGLSGPFVDQANGFACQGLVPDRTILLVTGGDARTGLARATHRGADRLERAGEEFHARVNDAFLEIARDHPDRIRVVTSDDRKSRTAASVFRELADLFPWMAGVVDDEGFFKALDRPRKGRGRSGGRTAADKAGGRPRSAANGTRGGAGDRGNAASNGKAGASDGKSAGRRGKGAASGNKAGEPARKDGPADGAVRGRACSDAPAGDGPATARRPPRGDEKRGR